MRNAFGAVVLVGLAACGSSSMGSNMNGNDLGAGGSMRLTSTAFTEGGTIPPKYADDAPGCGPSGRMNTSPPLAWTGAPSGTASFALLVEDADFGDFAHWYVWDLSSSTTSLAEGAATSGTLSQGGEYHPAPTGAPARRPARRTLIA
jgi:hypothetical protein